MTRGVLDDQGGGNIQFRRQTPHSGQGPAPPARDQPGPQVRGTLLGKGNAAQGMHRG